MLMKKEEKEMRQEHIRLRQQWFEMKYSWLQRKIGMMFMLMYSNELIESANEGLRQLIKQYGTHADYVEFFGG